MSSHPQHPDPSSPPAVAAATFATGFRGFDQSEVRAFLGRVAEALGEVQRENSRLHAEIEQLRAVMAEPAVLDADTVAALAGEETARVLTTAREAAAQVRTRAEEGAARLLRDASDEAARVRSEAAEEVARSRAEAAEEATRVRAEATEEAAAVLSDLESRVEQRRAEADAEVEALLADAAERAEDEVEQAKQQGREMVAEARAVRERMLSDLARRREVGRAQIEALRGRRDLLAEAIAIARRQLEAAEAELLDADAGAFAPDAGGDLPPLEDRSVEGAPIEDTPVEGAPVEDTPVEEAPGVLPVAGAPAAASGDAAGDVDDLFDRMRSSKPHAVVARAAAGSPPAPAPSELSPASAGVLQPAPAPEPEAAPRPTETVVDRVDSFAARTERLGPVLASLTRHLKRVLADEQNEVLDLLRRGAPPADVDAAVGAIGDQVVRFQAALRDDLRAAADAGAASTGGATPPDPAVDPALADLETAVVGPLRARLGRALDQAGGDAVEVASLLRAAYREWRTQRADELAEHLAFTAYAHGQLAGLPPGRPVTWQCDPSTGHCAECDDDVLGGAVAAGEPFPTGHRCPPAHPGCRCLLLPVDG